MVMNFPPGDQMAGGEGVRSLFWITSSYQNMKSSAVKGTPSDHFTPLRRCSVMVLPSSDQVQDSARLGSTVRPSLESRRITASMPIRLLASPNSPVEECMVRAVPPYC